MTGNETQKVLRALLDGGWWTVDDLAEETGVNTSTVRTVLNRNERAFEKRPSDEPAGHAGRRKDFHRLLSEFRPEIERRAAVQDFGDPIERSIRVVEQATEAWRGASSDEERQQVVELASLQSAAARRLIENGREQRADREVRLVTAQKRLADLVKGQEAPQDENDWAVATHYSGMKAAMHRPPRAAWQRYLKMIRRIIEHFSGSWDEAPATAASFEPALAVVIDAIPASSDSLSPLLVKTLRERGMLVATLAVNGEWDSRKRDAFMRAVAALNDEPVACLAPIFLTLDSNDATSRSYLSTFEELNRAAHLQKAVRAARAALGVVAKSKEPTDLEQTAFYGAFIANAEAHVAESELGVWDVTRGPVILDKSVDQGLEARVGKNGMYVCRAAGADLGSVVLHWTQSAALPGIANPLRALGH